MKHDLIEEAITRMVEARSPMRVNGGKGMPRRLNESGDWDFTAEAAVSINVANADGKLVMEVEPSTKKASVKFSIEIEARTWGIKDISITIPEQDIVLPIEVTTWTEGPDKVEQKEITLRPHLFRIEREGASTQYTVVEMDVQLNADLSVNEAESTVTVTGGQ